MSSIVSSFLASVLSCLFASVLTRMITYVYGVYLFTCLISKLLSYMNAYSFVRLRDCLPTCVLVCMNCMRVYVYNDLLV